MVNFNVNMIFSNYNKLISAQTSLEKQMKTVEKTNEKYKEMSKQLVKVNSQISEMDKKRGAFSTLVSGTVLERFTRLNEKFTKFNKAFETIGKKKGFDIGLKDFFKDFGKQTSSFVGNFTAIFGKGITGSIKLATNALRGFMIGLSGTMAVLAPFLPIILGIVAVVGIMQRVWRQNIGGMQTLFFKLVGALKDAWAKFAVGFDKALRALAPLFKVTFGLMEIILTPIIKIIEGVFLGLIEVIKPILEVIGDMFRPLAELFGLKDQGGGFRRVMEGISKTLQGVGKVLGWIIRVGLWPLRLQFMAIHWVVKKLMDLLKGFWDTIKGIGRAIADFFLNPFRALKAMLDGLKLPSWLQAILDFIIGKKTGIGKGADEQKQARLGVEREKSVQRITRLTTNKSNTVNNNQQLAIHSASAITPQNARGILDVASSYLNLGVKA